MSGVARSPQIGHPTAAPSAMPSWDLRCPGPVMHTASSRVSQGHASALVSVRYNTRLGGKKNSRGNSGAVVSFLFVFHKHFHCLLGIALSGTKLCVPDVIQI